MKALLVLLVVWLMATGVSADEILFIGEGQSFSGVDIDPANILFSEDAADSVNNITAFAGDDMTLTATGAGDIIIDANTDVNIDGGNDVFIDAATDDVRLGAGDDIVVTPGGDAGEDFVINALANGDFVLVGAVDHGWEFEVGTFEVATFPVFNIYQRASGVMDFDHTFTLGGTGVRSFNFGRALGINDGAQYTLYEIGGTEIGRLNSHGNHVSVPQTQVIPDDTVPASAATANIEPYAGSFQVTCNDPDGCEITHLEANAVDGTAVTWICMTANDCVFIDTLNVTELRGGVSRTLSTQYSTLGVIYASDRWVQTFESGN
jgi:hypothetical protein